MREPKIDINLVLSRRAKLAKKIQGETLVLVSHPEFIRNNDVPYPYRQDSNFYYLTGFEEPGSVFIFRPGKSPEAVLFVQPKNEAYETWNGFRFGVKGAKSHFCVDEAYSMDQLKKLIPEFLSESKKIFYSKSLDSEVDGILQKCFEKAPGKRKIEALKNLLGEMRVIKSDYEIATLSKAIEISAEGHLALMKKMKPNINERELHGHFISEIMAQGAKREGYGSIMASGNNATTLHYVFNDCECKEGELFLVDAGAEYDFYTGDITRTYPVNGRFTDVQKRIYNKILYVQKQIISMIRPGFLFENLQKKTIELLTDVMIEENLLRGTKENIIKKETYKKYYPHGVSHWLGSDVHDSGLYEIDGKSRPLEERMCFTVEPGIYIPEKDADAPKELRGIGIRIEDNILVTKEGCQVLSEKAIKEVSDIENFMAAN